MYWNVYSYNYLLYSTLWKVYKDPQQAAIAFKMSSLDLHPKKVEFCPAADNSSESSPTP